MGASAMFFAIFALALIIAAEYPFFLVADKQLFQVIMGSIVVTLTAIAFFFLKAALGRYEETAPRPKMKLSGTSKFLLVLSAVSFISAILAIGALKLNLRAKLLPALSEEQFLLWTIFAGSLLMLSAAVLFIIALVVANQEKIARASRK